MRRRLLLLCLLAPFAAGLFAPAAFAQVFTGRVVDAETEAPLAGATLQAGAAGAATDAEGRFTLPLPGLPATVVVRFLGYQPLTLRLTAGDLGPDGHLSRTLRLQPDVFALGEVTVTGENAAVGILRKVLARKAALVAQVQSYEAEAYSRLLLARTRTYDDRQQVPLRLTETLSRMGWRAGGGLYEEVVARRRVPDGGPFLHADLAPVPDFFFEDVVELDGRRFIGPAHPDVLDVYDVLIGERLEAGGRRLIDIAFTPRGPRADAFTGRVRVVDSLFVFAEVELRPAAALTGGYREQFEVTYAVRFSPSLGPAWLPELFSRHGYVVVGAAGVTLPTVYFRQTSLLVRRRPLGGEVPRPWRSAPRYYNPAGVFAGEQVYERGRDLLPLEPLEQAALALPPTPPLRERLWKEGFLRRFVVIPLEGTDDP